MSSASKTHAPSPLTAEPAEAAAATASEGLLLPPAASAAKDQDLAGASVQVYLERTVMGVLALGLEDVCRVRPPNPVDYLGSYLLRRSSASNSVEVTYEDTVPKAVPTDAE